MRRILLLCTILILGCISFRAIAWSDGNLSNCNIFPANNYWNRDISAEPVHPQSAAIIANINANGGDFVHPDFGGAETDYYGIPWITVTNAQTPVDSITFTYDDESDHVPYPIPYNAPVEGGPNADGDNHVIVINTDTCKLYETYASYPAANNSASAGHNKWTTDSGAVFNLNSNALRPDGWTSADAGGLPIFAGLARCNEASTGTINHALRFTVSKPRNGVDDNHPVYVFPATHEAGSYTNTLAPVFGARFRLKANYPEAGFQGQALAIVKALKRYGMIMADGGSNWYISGDYPVNNNGWIDCWDDDQLQDLKSIPGTAFEVLAYPGTSTPTAPHFSTKTPTLTWSRITWAVSYEVQVSTLSTFTTFTSYTSTSTSVTLSPALAEGTYYWRVRGKNATNTFGPFSATGSFVIALVP